MQVNTTQDGLRTIAVLAFDAEMFEQASQCIATIRRYCSRPIAIGVVAIGLASEQIAELSGQGITVFTDVRSLPCFVEAPPYAYALTCRPYLRDIFPGYDVYMWIDADVRFVEVDAFDFYLEQAAATPLAIVVASEVDQSYSFFKNPESTRVYHQSKFSRLSATHGENAALYLQYTHCFNAGIFAMHRDCATWKSYRRNLEHAMKGPFNHMLEQDAMLVAIAEDGMLVRVAPPLMNWLCSVSIPVFAHNLQRWVRPFYPHLPISVLHLTNSGWPVQVDGEQITYYELYKRMRLTQ